MPTLAPVREADWREALHPRGEDGRFIDLLSALAKGDEKDVTGALKSVMYDVPKADEVTFDVSGVKITKPAGKGTWQDEHGKHLGFPEFAASAVRDRAKEKQAADSAAASRAASGARPPAATHVSRVLADSGDRPLPSGTPRSREGIRVTPSQGGRVRVGVDQDTGAERRSQQLERTLREKGFTVERTDPTTLHVTGAPSRKAPKGKTTYQHVLPDGTVVTRTSAREYTHVVTGVKPSTGKRVDLQWSGSKENAEKGKRQLVARGFDAVRVEKIKPPDAAAAPKTLQDDSARGKAAITNTAALKRAMKEVGVRLVTQKEAKAGTKGLVATSTMGLLRVDARGYGWDADARAEAQRAVEAAAQRLRDAGYVVNVSPMGFMTFFEEKAEEAFAAPAPSGVSRFSGAARDARASARARGLKPGSHRLTPKGGGGSWDEQKHPRGSAGTSQGGKFVKKGSSGDDVRAVQKRVGARTDGKFGARTEAAVRRFQKQHGLVVDGKVGRQTALALAGHAAKARRTKIGKLSAADRRMIRKSAKRGVHRPPRRAMGGEVVEEFDPDQPRAPDGRWIKMAAADLVPGTAYEFRGRMIGPGTRTGRVEDVTPGGMVRLGGNVGNFPGHVEFEAREVPADVAQAVGKTKVGDGVEVRRHGKTYTGTVTRITKKGRVYARVTYDNGATREVPVD